MNNNALIQVENLTREFKLAQGKEGFAGSIYNLFSRKHKIIKAVDDISFSINSGELVGYVGENGAGKSTTIKMLTGILNPTSGHVRVAGVVPYEDRIANAFNIGVVFGQRTQLWWDLPVRDSFDLLRSIYRVPEKKFRSNYKELADALGLDPLLSVPVRKLSLGQRMRCDLAASLLHGPKILYLDEPTIGLDLIAKDNVRKILKKINSLNGVTIILTTHDMDDIEALCDRIIIIDEGKIAYVGTMDQLKADHVRHKILEVEFHDYNPELTSLPMLTVIKSEANKKWLRFDQGGASIHEVISTLFKDYCVKDISIHEPKVEDVVKSLYESGPATLAQTVLK
ncbi:Efflux ABC transporter, ATP-binding protein [hydrothermal vent metagenome]|uniref:Efflux ABC transporter, ATP-binding protein n=1 Tax=hydrothermal vent metagenome TaxID=652676 RepID=A0A3B1C678_9ZZZZ